MMLKKMAPSAKSAPNPLQNAYHFPASLSTPVTCSIQCQTANKKPPRPYEKLQRHSILRLAWLRERHGARRHLGRRARTSTIRDSAKTPYPFVRFAQIKELGIK